MTPFIGSTDLGGLPRRVPNGPALFGLVALFLLAIVEAASARQEEKRARLDCGDDCEIRLSTHRGLEIRRDQPDIRMRFGGRFHLDGAAIIEDTTRMPGGWLIRRGRPEFRLRVFEKVRVKVDYEFAPNRQGWRNVWARYAPADWVWLKVGNFITPFGLEDPASSNHTLFMERSLVSALAPAFQTGGAVGFRGKLGRRESRHRFTFAAMIGTAPFSSGEDDRHKSEHLGIAARFTYAPIARRKRVVHVGGSVEYRNVSANSQWRTRSRPESSIARAILNTSRLDDVSSTFSWAVEAAWLHGPISAQAEYMSIHLARRGAAEDARVWGVYGQVGWILTGESRRYSRGSGSMRGPVPDRAWGAIEVAARVSHLDLIDRDIRGGRATDLTLGVNWYLRQNVRLMFNYVFVDARVRRTLERDRPQIFQGRFAVFF